MLAALFSRAIMHGPTHDMLCATTGNFYEIGFVKPWACGFPSEEALRAADFNVASGKNLHGCLLTRVRDCLLGQFPWIELCGVREWDARACTQAWYGPYQSEDVVRWSVDRGAWRCQRCWQWWSS